MRNKPTPEYVAYVAVAFMATAAAITCIVATIACISSMVDPPSATTYPQSTEDCPPGHVWVATGEIPQSGCMPEGTARALGATY